MYYLYYKDKNYTTSIIYPQLNYIEYWAYYILHFMSIISQVWIVLVFDNLLYLGIRLTITLSPSPCIAMISSRSFKVLQ